jgi:WD40 repeat protein
MSNLEEFSLGAFVVEAAFIGDAAAYALGDGSLRLASGTSVEAVDIHSGAILAAAPTRDGKSLVTGGDDGRVALVDAKGVVDVVAELPRKWIDHIATGPSGAIAYASGRQVTVKLGDGRERSRDLDRAAGGLAFAPKGLRLAIASYDGVALWWAGADAEPIWLHWKGAHLAALYSPDGRHVVTAMQENALHAWRIEDGQDMRMSGYPAKPRSLAWTAKGRFLASSGAEAAILWPFHSKDGPTGKEPTQIGAREGLVTRVACHPRKEQVAIGYSDGMVMLAGIADKEETLLRDPGGGPVSALVFDTRGDRLAFGTEEGTAGVIGTGE